jgi:GNAT superfamily N-acetyltransferase
MYLSKNLPNFDQVVCRPALPIDTPGMLELTSQIWDGEDYLPGTWQDWLFDPHGLLAVAEFRGKIVGIGKLTKLSEQDWWMEGLRVHPQFEGNKIASRIHRYLLDFWEKAASGSIRFGTISTREPVKHLARVNEFQVVGEYSTFKAGIPDNPDQKKGQFTPVRIGDLGEAIEWLRSSSTEKLAFGLMNLGWQFAPPREEYLVEYLENGQAWWWHRTQGMVIIVKKIAGTDIMGRILLLVVNQVDLGDILVELRFLAKQIGYSGITWLAPLIPDNDNHFAEAGFVRDWENSLLVYERPPTRAGIRGPD